MSAINEKLHAPTSCTHTHHEAEMFCDVYGTERASTRKCIRSNATCSVNIARRVANLPLQVISRNGNTITEGGMIMNEDVIIPGGRKMRASTS